jgi:hypothetical protein
MEANARDYESGYRNEKILMEINMEEWKLKGIFLNI